MAQVMLCADSRNRKALSEAALRLRSAEDFGRERHKTPGEGKLGAIGGQQGLLGGSVCMGEKTVLTALQCKAKA